MTKVLWIMNKYVTGSGSQAYYPYFLKSLQDELKDKRYELYFVFFSDRLKKNMLGKNNHYCESEEYDNLSEDEIAYEARRIEREYEFTLKQAWFPDILQTSKFQNSRKISVPEIELNETKHLVVRFVFLEKLILDQKIDVLFSDVSPEAEMEFGRSIGLKHDIPVLKTYQGSFLGRTVLLQHSRFGKDRLVEAVANPEYSTKDAKDFVDDFISNRRPAYKRAPKLEVSQSMHDKIKNKFAENGLWFIISTYSLQLLKRIVFRIYLWFEQHILNPMIYYKFKPEIPFLFFGFHLNRESTMGLRSLPYVNQTSLVEMISRVLPYGYTLYVREHPHWPKTFPFRYLSKVKKYPNVRLLSPTISIHDILRNAQAILVYNANTGIEALMHGKPVLSFAPNIYYKHHPGVDYCDDLFELGAKLSSLINRNVKKEDTYNYIRKLFRVSNDLSLNAETFLSDNDAKQKAIKFAKHLITTIEVCLRKARKCPPSC